ncbi:hypothetical protein BP6252_08112 [Coleophoma cylindrospora]|uniref:Uncharacterized protein n=1 Tax=Coleophoma cylindrospora TaxID=1849047 RepID=A0A3D8RBW2_9HELO|nr:hypothetical protein BP6252_08112 [Coleophoma cylindrospora]
MLSNIKQLHAHATPGDPAASAHPGDHGPSGRDARHTNHRSYGGCPCQTAHRGEEFRTKTPAKIATRAQRGSPTLGCAVWNTVRTLGDGDCCGKATQPPQPEELGIWMSVVHNASAIRTIRIHAVLPQRACTPSWCRAAPRIRDGNGMFRRHFGCGEGSPVYGMSCKSRRFVVDRQAEIESPQGCLLLEAGCFTAGFLDVWSVVVVEGCRIRD